MSKTFSAIYRRPDNRFAADWISYDSLNAAMLGPEFNVFVGERLGYLERVPCGAPAMFGYAGDAVDLRR